MSISLKKCLRDFKIYITLPANHDQEKVFPWQVKLECHLYLKEGILCSAKQNKNNIRKLMEFMKWYYS